MLNFEYVNGKINMIISSVDKLNELKNISRSEFVAKPDLYAVGEHHLRRSLEAMLATGRHIIARMGLGYPKDYGCIIKIMEESGILKGNLVHGIKELAGFRNRLVHCDPEPAPEELHNLICRCLEEFEGYCRQVTDYVDALSRQGRPVYNGSDYRHR